MREYMLAWYWGDECPVSWSGKAKGEQLRKHAKTWWHYHRHVILILDADKTYAASEILSSWMRASSTVCEHGAAQESAYQNGKWWREISIEDLLGGVQIDDIYQAAKYAAVTSDMPPLRLAEFISAAHRRRWHGAGGALYGRIGEHAEPPAHKLLSSPGTAPDIDGIDPSWGYSYGAPKGSDLLRADDTDRITWDLLSLAVLDDGEIAIVDPDIELALAEAGINVGISAAWQSVLVIGSKEIPLSELAITSPEIVGYRLEQVGKLSGHDPDAYKQLIWLYQYAESDEDRLEVARLAERVLLTEERRRVKAVASADYATARRIFAL